MLRGKDGKLYPREKARQKKPQVKKPKSAEATTAPAKPPVGNAPPAPAGNATGEPDALDDDDDGDDDDGIVDADDGEGEQANVEEYKVSWRRVAEGVVVVQAPDDKAAARKVRQLAEQRTALEIQSDSPPVVEVNQVEDSTGAAVAVSRTGELGLETAVAETDHANKPSTPTVAPTATSSTSAAATAPPPMKPTEDNPATVTLFNKKYEVAWTAGMWFRRADQHSGWVACTKELAKAIEEQLAAGD